MLSNKKWFLSYSRIRTFIITIFILVILLKLFPSLLPNEEYAENDLFYILIPLLLTILLFDYFQKPSFLELSSVSNGIKMKLYQPDPRYLFFLKQNAIHTRLITKEEILTYRIHKHFLPVLNQIEFFIKDKEGTISKTGKINIGWMSKDQKIVLDKIIPSTVLG